MYLGWNIGGTNCSACVANAEGEILELLEWPSAVETGPDRMLEVAYKKLLQLDSHKIEAIGVSVGGPVDMWKGQVLSPPHLPGWDYVPVRSLLELWFHKPVRVLHDAAACALAEHRWGAGKGSRRLAYLTCGTGCGLGLVFDGQVYIGAEGASPEFGHIQLDPDLPESFGVRGSVDALCSAKGLSLIAAHFHPEVWPEPPSPEVVAKSASARDIAARKVLVRSAHYMAQACAIVHDTLRLDCIVLGSLATYLRDTEWLLDVRDEFKTRALDSRCRIVGNDLKDRLQPLSAIAAAMDF